MSANWKEKILTVDEFWSNRPDMSVHTNEAVQSCIFQALGLLDSETNGLLGQVWSFNMLDPGFAPTSDLKRNEWELAQLKEAAIVQTQYMLNLGNDLSEGSSSFSIGNINSSFSRPTSRDIIAPGVRKLLQNGRVYVLQYFGNDKSGDKKCNSFDPYSTQPITRALGDKRYVEVEQGEQAAGNVAVVGSNGLVSFANPNDLNFSNFSATRIKDWLINEYVSIDNITNQLFRGKDLDGVHSGMTRGEIYTLNSLSFYPWNKFFNYKKDQIVNYLVSNKDKLFLKRFIALRDNVNKDPTLNSEDWKEIGNAEIDLTGVSDIVYERLVEKFQPQLDNFKVEVQDIQNAFRGEVSQNLQDFYNNINQQLPNLISQEVKTQLDQLPTTDIVLFRKGQVVLFSDGIEASRVLIQELKLVLNDDFEVLPIGKYLKTDNYGGYGGSSYIKEQHLPKISWKFGFDFNVRPNPNYTSVANQGASAGVGINTIQTSNVDSETFFAYGSAPTGSGEKLNYPSGGSWTLNLNTLPQNKFEPEYNSVYAVVFLKDIIKKAVINGGGDVDLTNYYNKSEVDNLVNTLNTKDTTIEATANQNKIDIQQLVSNDNELWEYLDTQFVKDQDLATNASVQANTNEITNLKQEQTTQNNNITNNTNLINQVINDLNNATLINYQGEWTNGTAKLGQVWSYNNQMWLCKVASTTTTPQNGNNWDLLSAPTIDLSNYYTKTQIDQSQQAQDQIITTNTNDINTLKQTINTQQTKITNLETKITTLESYINELKTKIKWDSNSTKLLFNDNKYIKVNANNAYKFVAGNDEPLASDSWVQDRLSNYFTKTDLTNRSTTLILKELNVGQWSSSNIRLYSYANDQSIINFNASINWLIGNSDKRFGQNGTGAAWGNR